MIIDVDSAETGIISVDSAGTGIRQRRHSDDSLNDSQPRIGRGKRKKTGREKETNSTVCAGATRL